MMFRDELDVQCGTVICGHDCHTCLRTIPFSCVSTFGIEVICACGRLSIHLYFIWLCGRQLYLLLNRNKNMLWMTSMLLCLGLLTEG